MNPAQLYQRARAQVTKRWKASEWSRMSGRDIAWHLAGWALFLACVLVVGVAYAGALALWPRQVCVLTLAGILSGGWCWVGMWIGNNAGGIDHDRLDYAKRYHDAATNSPAADLLAEVGPITGPTPVTDVEPPEWVTNPPYLATEGAAS